MAQASADHKVRAAYESIRRREYELITELLDVLPKIDKLDESRVSQVRDAMFHADHPFLMVFVGPFSSGKSSIINGLVGNAGLLEIGPTPTTDRISMLRWGEQAQRMNSAGDVDTVFYPAEMLRKVSFVDTPGLESVFREHEEVTRKFLHRSDVVVLVMLANQAMTDTCNKYLQMFKEYGKKVIVVLSQADLVTSEEDRNTVYEFVQERAAQVLGLRVPIWFVSAKQGMAARDSEGRLENHDLWRESGMHQFDEYIEKQLSDAERMQQKLQTPLQIVQNAHKAALEAVRDNQATFDKYRNIRQNIDEQLASQRREQERTVQETNESIRAKFRTNIERSGEALRDIFQFSRAFGSFGGGLLELVGLARLFRGGKQPSYVETAFYRHQVFETIDELDTVVDKLGPRLEGQDMQDIDNLVKYAQRETNQLPQELSGKVIGTVQGPMKYDRAALRAVRPKLEELSEQARVVETDKVEDVRRNTIMYLAVWELLVLVLVITVLALWGSLSTPEAPLVPVFFVVLLATAGLLGFLALPLRGRMVHATYSRRLNAIRDDYIEAINKAADQQLDYAMQLRRDAIAPLTRLVDAQTRIQDDQLTRLRTAEDTIVKLESDLNAMVTRKRMGVTL